MEDTVKSTKFKWQKNTEGGITLCRLVPSGYNPFWQSTADVFKAKRGTRWIVRVVVWDTPTDPPYTQHAARTLREAMRLAVFLVGVQYGG